MGRILVDHRGTAVERTTWRTLAVFGHTLTGSSRIVARAAVGRLRDCHVDRTARRWCDHVFRLARATLALEGEENVYVGRPYVLMSNHQSLLDVPAVMLSFPGRLRFVAKQELRRVPVFGRAMEEVGIVFVDRSDRERAIAQLGAAEALLAAGTSVFVAAEGTRSKDGVLGPLKKGGFHLARTLGTPILPTWIDGALEVIPPGSLASVTGQTVTVRFGPEIATEDRPVEALVEQTREALLALQAAGRRRGRPPQPDASGSAWT